MKKFLLSLVIAISAIASQAQDPAITMTTTMSTGQTAYMYIATSSGTTIQADWGDGNKVDFAVNSSLTLIYGDIAGSTIKLYGSGITYLNVSSNGITSIDVSAATTLQTLYVDSNDISSIDLTGNTALKELYCYSNNIATLDLSANAAIEKLDCHSNGITALNLSANVTLKTLYCSNNNLTSLDLTSNTSLFDLDCSNNQLTSISLTNGISEVRCSNNQLTSINVSPVSSMLLLDCSSNSIASLDLSSNTNLQYLICNNNLLTTLDLSNNTTLTEVYCSDNRFTLTTLPLMDANWSTYTYSPQAKLPLAKDSYTTGEEIDLNSQVTVNSVNTIYTWKTKGGQTLTSGTDYTESNGIFTFSTGQGDSLYCEMTNTNFPDLTLTTTSIAVPLPAPTITMTTTTPVGNTFSFVVAATADNTPIQVDWGNGTLENFTIGNSSTSVTGALTGSKINVYGTGIFFLNVNDKQLTTLDINQATALTSLNCGNNKLTVLDITKNTLISILYCYSNQLTSLDISKNIDLTLIECEWNQLVSLDVSKNINLNTLKCWRNEISFLDLSNNKALSNLYCGYNKLTSIDVSNNTVLRYFECYSNQLSSLDLSKNKELIYLHLIDNRFTIASLPVPVATWNPYNYFPQAKLPLPKAEYALNEEIDLSSQLTAGSNTTVYTWKTAGGVTLVKDVDYTESNGVFAFIKQPGDYFYCEMTNATFPDLTLTTENISITQTEPTITMTTTTPVGSTFSFEIAANADNTPILVDWGNGTTESFTIGTSSTSVTGTLTGSTINVYGTGIWLLNVENKQLTNLDVNKATALTYLYCSINQLSTIDISQNTNLWIFYCDINQLTSLDVTKNTALQGLFCYSNQLTALDVTKNSALTYLYCGGNQLTALDVSNNTALTYLYCGGNQLTALDVSNNTALTYLECYSNNLTTLDVSNNSTLESLECYSNNLTTLDVSNNSTLTYLNCESNPLTTLDVSNNTALTFLSCESNHLTALDISQNAALKYLYCQSNQLTALDITHNTALTKLDCYSNRLTGLDVTQNSALKYLYCQSNKLTSLDVSNDTSLTSLKCENNLFKFSALPIKQPDWTTYTYNPQGNIILAKKQYGLTETVDLSSELTVNSNTTNYAWKTKGGSTLVAGTDYNVTGGVTTFLKVQTDSVYCQLTNASFPDLTLNTSNIKVSQFPLSVTENEFTVKAYPNPATDNFSVELAEEIVKVEVYTIAGSKVFESSMYNSTRVTVPATGLPKGTLIIKVYSRNGVYLGKVVKM